MFSRRATSATVSRATSFSDSASLDMERTNSLIPSVTLNGNGRRTMSLEEEDEDDRYDSPWHKLQATSGPMSSVSENNPDESIEIPSTEVVTALRISHLAKGCTTTQLYHAFETTKDEMRIEVQGTDEALLHFDSAERAMKAYFHYLASTSSLGTVSPHEPGTESLSSSPVKQSGSMLRSRRSFQMGNSSTTMLSALTNISSWRSTDKLPAMNPPGLDNSRLGHRSNSSRSDINSKSVERIATVQRHATSPTILQSPNLSDNVSHEEKPLTMRAPATTNSQVAPQAVMPASKTAVSSREANLPTKSTSAARKFMAGLGLKSRHPK